MRNAQAKIIMVALLFLTSCTSQSVVEVVSTQRYKVTIKFGNIPNEMRGYIKQHFRLRGIIDTTVDKADYIVSINSFDRQELTLSTIIGGNTETLKDLSLQVQSIKKIHKKEGSADNTEILKAPLIIKVSKSITNYPDKNYLSNNRTNESIRRQLYRTASSRISSNVARALETQKNKLKDNFKALDKKTIENTQPH